MKERNEASLKISHIRKPYTQPIKMSLNEVKKFFPSKQLDEKQLEAIRTFAYQLGEIFYKNWTEEQLKKQQKENEESNSLHTSIYRRAS